MSVSSASISDLLGNCFSSAPNAENHDRGKQRPVSGLADIQPANVVERHALPPLAAGAAGVPGAPGALPGAPGAVGSVSRFTCRLRMNSLTFCFSSGTDLISTNSGKVSQGELSMLRISVETRALDCA